MIEASELTMRYGQVTALDCASFQVGKGEVVGLLGPNGAGKSTTMKILTTFIVPTSGTATVAGKSIAEDPLAVRAATGYLPEQPPLYGNMEVAGYLNFAGRAHGLSGKELKERIAWVVDRCRLLPVFRRPIKELSKGYKQRTALAQALIHDPQVLILDEPTSGLDPKQILEIRNLVRELAEEKTIILSTHIMQEVEAVADRIVVISNGKIAGQGTMDQLRSMAHESCRVRFAVRAPSAESAKAIGDVDAVEITNLLEDTGGVSRFELLGRDDRAMIANLSMLAMKRDWQVLEITNCPYSMEETFMALIDNRAAAKGGAA